MLSTLLLCLVVGISDGDTLTARCPGPDAGQPYQQVRVRLAEIDAPEHGQAFARRSRQHLSSLCYRVEARLRVTDTDRYGRTVARVECRGQDASLEMVRAGMAWAYTAYLSDPAIARAERQARAQRLGLFAHPHAIPPWEYRRKPPAVSGPDPSGCHTGPRGGRYRIIDGQKRYGKGAGC